MAAQQDQSAEPMAQAQAFINRVAGRYYMDYVRTFCPRPYHGLGDTSELIALFDRAAPSHWRLLFALTFGQMKTRAELAGQRIAPLIGAFLVGDVLQKKQE